MNGANINVHQREHEALMRAKWLLRITYGIIPIVAGADKFLNYMVTWAIYLNPVITEKLSMWPANVMKGAGIIEMFVGIIILFTPYTRWGAYILAVWLLFIAANLFSMGMYFDVAVRDITIAMGAIALGMMSDKIKGD